MEQQKQKKQFSLSILMRIFVGVIVVVSLIVFANSVMKYNELKKEEEALEQIVYDLRILREELTLRAGSADQLSYILSDYKAYQEAKKDPAFAEYLTALEEKHQELLNLMNESDNKEHIERLAREKLGLYYPNEQIFYANSN